VTEPEHAQGRVDKKIISEHFLRYRVAIEALPKTGYLRVGNEELIALKKNINEPKSRTPFLEKKPRNETTRLHLRMEGQAHPIYFQIGLDHTVISTPLYEPHYPHITAFHKELERWRTYYLEPKTLMREDVPLADTLTIGPKGENLAAFLNTLRSKKETAFNNLNLTLQRLLPTKSKIDVELTKEGRVGLKIYENGKSFSARLISEGTLRLIGLIAAVHPESPALLIGYEEPENGGNTLKFL
jgi:predicted ATPase